MTETNWSQWRKCPVCHVATSQPCRSLSGTVTGGRPDGIVTVLDEPHKLRKRRSKAVTS